MKKYLFGLFVFFCGMAVAIVFNQSYLIKDFDIRHIPTLSFADGSVYSGELNDKQLLEGKGRIEGGNGSTYEGEFRNGLIHGQGEYKNNRGYKYDGEFINGLPNGGGEVTYENGVRYVGQVKDFSANGIGEMIYTDGQVYIGEFKNDLAEGKGKWLSPNNYTYAGEFKNNQFDGKGKIVYEDGSHYAGEFKKGKFNGKGKYKAANGNVYLGDFVDEVFTGKGEISFANGAKQKGNFQNWILSGKGTSIDENGNKYKGEFEHGYLKEGVYTAKNGETYEGGFEYGQYNGIGKLVDEKGNIFEGEFEYGSKHGKGTLVYSKPVDGFKSINGDWLYGKLAKADEFKIFTGEDIAEFALYNQQQLLADTLDKLQLSDAGKVEIYTLAVAPYGDQEVFHREINYVENYFNQYYKNPHHSVYLSNSTRVLDDRPLATLTSFENSINKIADSMDKQQDVLFLYITSHGSKDKMISFSQPGINLVDLSAENLGQLLDDSGIKWKVIVLSACYSGGFIDDLKDKYTLILTASAADKMSFGCEDDNQFTYFGEALFQDALPDSKSLIEAFAKVKTIIKEREDLQALENSNPQLYQPEAIVNYLHQQGL